MAAGAKKKKVAVIGGGPAGMQAAITAAQRDHAVTLLKRRTIWGASSITPTALPSSGPSGSTGCGSSIS